uniref:RRM domain-containing protein n=1 Tax=Anopheles culicifacies TaxID=139723 RepID=A0A182LXG8_9DIPT
MAPSFSAPDDAEVLQYIDWLVKHKRYVVYVGNLDVMLTSKDIDAKFGYFGAIANLMYPLNCVGLGMGYAVIAYYSKFDAIRATRAVNGLLMAYLYAAATNDTSSVNVTDDTLCISNVSMLLNEAIIRDVFGVGIKCVTFHWHVYGYRYAVVTFDTVTDAVYSMAAFNGIDLGDGFRWQITRHCQKSLGPIKPIVLRKHQVMRRNPGYVRISNLSKTVNEKCLYNIFSHDGIISEVFVLRCLGRHMRCAFVCYDTENAAKCAAYRHNRAYIKGESVMVEHVQNELVQVVPVSVRSTCVTQ